jgi:hypothetical protein
MDFYPGLTHPEIALLTDFGPSESDRIASASADIRNALVPLQTIADVLNRRDDAECRDWCVRMLELEVKRIVEILDTL